MSDTPLGPGAGNEHLSNPGIEQDQTGIVNLLEAFMSDQVTGSERQAYQALVAALPEDSSNWTSEDFVTEGRAGFMDAHPHSFILGTNDPRSVEIERALNDVMPRLKQRRFIVSNPFQTQIDQEKVIIIESLYDEPPLKLPLANFVDADAFTSWEGRPGHFRRDRRDVLVESQAMILDYASRSTTPPPLESVYGYVQPNGIILFATAAGAHRTAAAIKRGNETIETSSLKLYMLPNNIVGLDDAQIPSDLK